MKRKQERKRREVGWASISDLCVALFGCYLKTECDRIQRHARRDSKGFGSIPSEFVRIRKDGERVGYEYLISEKSKVFFTNLLTLEVVFRPQTVAKLLKGNLNEAELKAELERAEVLLGWQARTYCAWAWQLRSVADRLLHRKLDLAAEPLLTVSSQAIGQLARAEPKPLDLYIVRRIAEIDERVATDEGPAEKALLLLSIGEVDAADLTLRTAAEGSSAFYARAMVYLARASQAADERTKLRVMAEESDNEANFTPQLEEADDRVQTNRWNALGQLAAAYGAWPQRRAWNGKLEYVDGFKRGRVALLIGELAFASRDEWTVLQNGDRRSRGESVDHIFGPDLDPVLLDVAPDLESRGLRAATSALAIYELLSELDYERFSREWLRLFDRCQVPDVMAFFERIHLSNERLTFTREHLQKLLNESELAAFFERLQLRHVQFVASTHESLREIMLRDPDDDPESYEF